MVVLLIVGINRGDHYTADVDSSDSVNPVIRKRKATSASQIIKGMFDRVGDLNTRHNNNIREKRQFISKSYS